MTNERSVGIKEIKPKILNTLDHLISNLQAEESVSEVEWQAVMIAREVLAGASVLRIATAVEKTQKKIQQNKSAYNDQGDAVKSVKIKS